MNQHVKHEKYSFNIEPVPASFAAQLDFQPKKIISITIPTENDELLQEQVFIVSHNDESFCKYILTVIKYSLLRPNYKTMV